jgi:hypothetical protein
MNFTAWKVPIAATKAFRSRDYPTVSSSARRAIPVASAAI